MSPVQFGDASNSQLYTISRVPGRKNKKPILPAWAIGKDSFFTHEQVAQLQSADYKGIKKLGARLKWAHTQKDVPYWRPFKLLRAWIAAGAASKEKTYAIQDTDKSLDAKAKKNTQAPAAATISRKEARLLRKAVKNGVLTLPDEKKGLWADCDSFSTSRMTQKKRD